MTVIDLSAYRRRLSKHHPAIPPAHPAFYPIISAIADYCAVRGPGAAAAVAERTWRVFAQHYCKIYEDEMTDVGGHSVTYEELGELENWLYLRTQELRIAAGEPT